MQPFLYQLHRFLYMLCLIICLHFPLYFSSIYTSWIWIQVANEYGSNVDPGTVPDLEHQHDPVLQTKPKCEQRT
jgi:hypothetical protein